MTNDFQVLLTNKNFLYLWTSQILSQLTINILNYLFLIKLFNDTNSTIATSFLWIAYSIPSIVIGPIAAASIDILEKRKILIYTNLFQSLAIFLYALISSQSLFLLYGVVITYSFLNQFYVPAEQTSLPIVVEIKNLAYANGLFFITQQISIIIGFAIASIFLEYLGYMNSLFISAFLLFIAFISVNFLPEMKSEIKTERDFEKLFISFFTHIYEGYLFIKNNRIILAPFLLLMGLQVSLSIVAINTPVFATQLLDVASHLAGIYIVVPVGVGTAVGAILIPKLIRKGVRKSKLIKNSLFVLSISFLLLSFINKLLPQPIIIFISIILITLIGLGFVGVFIPTQTFLQEKTPGGLRGRVFGNYWFLVAIATLIPVIMSGTLVELLGARFLIFLLFIISFSILAFVKNKGSNFMKKNINFTYKGEFKENKST